MSHLKENNITYFRHLYRAWRWAFILVVHGIFPNVFKTTVSDEICKKSDKTREYLLTKQYRMKV
jgi:hypothetical protein